MPAAFAICLALTVAILLGSRLVLPSLPLRRGARPITVPGAIIATLGILGLAFHCGAMFFRGVIGSVPGTDQLVRTINQLGPVSAVLYAVPALLLLVGLRRQRLAVVGVLAVSLAVVGVTMYDRGPLAVHLSAIFVCVTLIAATVALLVSCPPKPRATPTGN